jgi:hypothetical protein
MAHDLSHTGQDRRVHTGLNSDYGRVTVRTYVVLLCAKLATLGGDLFKLLLGSSVGVANLKQQAFAADGLSVKLFDNLLTDLTGLETVFQSQTPLHSNV